MSVFHDQKNATNLFKALNIIEQQKTSTTVTDTANLFSYGQGKSNDNHSNSLKTTNCIVAFFVHVLATQPSSMQQRNQAATQPSSMQQQQIASSLFLFMSWCLPLEKFCSALLGFEVDQTFDFDNFVS